jgi:oligopeptide/dipeptide ABC transporter ATP-binding protein
MAQGEKRREPVQPANNGAPLLAIRDLTKRFKLPLGLLPWALRHRADVVTGVDHVSLEVHNGEILGIVGESGCGKTTLLRCLVRIYEPDSGQVLFEGQDLVTLKAQEMRRVRRKIQMVYQDPYSSLNPRLTVRQMLDEVLAVHHICPPDGRRGRAVQLLEMVGMGADALARLPSQFSGGQRQRLGIARALAMEPTVLLADEPVSALDVSIQAQVINLLMELRQELGLTMMFVSHDLRIVRHVSERVAVMYLGKVMEMGPTHRVFTNALHPYTQVLLAAAPRLDPTVRSEVSAVQGDPPNPIHIPPGCRFHPRCPAAMEQCRADIPLLKETESGHLAACHLY